jgi:hypothetical protein
MLASCDWLNSWLATRLERRRARTRTARGPRIVVADPAHCSRGWRCAWSGRRGIEENLERLNATGISSARCQCR